MLLRLTTPPTEGPAVKRAQHSLQANVFGEDFKPGKVDGVYGEATARAAIRAKYLLGYPDAKVKGTYGDELESYLTGTSLPPLYRLRRAQRAKQPAAPLRAAALKEALRHVGEKESPMGSNNITYSRWYEDSSGAGWTTRDPGPPWCAMFASYCYVHAGSKVFQKGEHYAYVPYVVHDARAGANGLSSTADPQEGDLVCYDWNGDGVADHVGLFQAWKNKAGGTFVAVEGNTGVGNDSNGGQVMKRDRKRSQVQVFVRVSR